VAILEHQIQASKTDIFKPAAKNPFKIKGFREALAPCPFLAIGLHKVDVVLAIVLPASESTGATVSILTDSPIATCYPAGGKMSIPAIVKNC
jgi:hypothetical protein